MQTNNVKGWEVQHKADVLVGQSVGGKQGVVVSE